MTTARRARRRAVAEDEANARQCILVLMGATPVLSRARLRAHHLVNEIRMGDLRFTGAETLSFV